ncbi:MAG TPA: peptidoglycan bridge formation glycyltransferase FemA/FemB family protein [Thermomicrobiaceae bacterium]|nr:peptidoglycan bridge formation glycyltransferase FemA/FemB family protein [Thermomicrobiaceae bacterium]
MVAPTNTRSFRLQGETLRAVEFDAQSAWDRTIEALGGGLLQSWAWGELKSRHGWEAVRLGLMSGEQPVRAAQVLLRRVGPLAVGYVPRGVAGVPTDDAATAAFTLALDRTCRRRRGVVCFFEPESGQVIATDCGDLGWAPSQTVLQPLRTIKVKVDVSDDELLGRMKPKTRYNVRLAERRGVTIRLGSESDLPAFYTLLQETGRRDAFGIHEKGYYADTLRLLGENAVLLIAEYDGQPAAAIIVARFGGEAIYLHGASASAYQRHMPAYLVQYAAMRWARERGCRMYDMWGIPETDDQPSVTSGDGNALNVRDGLWGVYRFKQGFGGEIVGYPGVFERVYMKPLMRFWRRFGPGIG